MMEDEFVSRRKWLNREDFLDLISITHWICNLNMDIIKDGDLLEVDYSTKAMSRLNYTDEKVIELRNRLPLESIKFQTIAAANNYWGKSYLPFLCYRV